MWWIILASVMGCGEVGETGATADTSVEAPPLVEYQCGETAQAYDGYPLVMLSAVGDGTDLRQSAEWWQVKNGVLSVRCDPGWTYTVRWLE